MMFSFRRTFYQLVVLPLSSAVIADYLNVELAILPFRFARIAAFFPAGDWIERDRAQFVWRDLPKNVFLYHAEWLDMPFLFLLLLIAQIGRPLRWFRKSAVRVSENQVIALKVMHCIP